MAPRSGPWRDFGALLGFTDIDDMISDRPIREATVIVRWVIRGHRRRARRTGEPAARRAAHILAAIVLEHAASRRGILA